MFCPNSFFSTLRNSISVLFCVIFSWNRLPECIPKWTNKTNLLKLRIQSSRDNFMITEVKSENAFCLKNYFQISFPLIKLFKFLKKQKSVGRQVQRLRWMQKNFVMYLVYSTSLNLFIWCLNVGWGIAM